MAFCHDFYGNGGIIQPGHTYNDGCFQNIRDVFCLFHFVPQDIQHMVDAGVIRNAYGDNGVDEIPAHIGNGAHGAIGDDMDTALRVTDFGGAQSNAFHGTSDVLDGDNVPHSG